MCLLEGLGMKAQWLVFAIAFGEVLLTANHRVKCALLRSRAHNESWGTTVVSEGGSHGVNLPSV
jgi:hypothetical protein